ncbi:hypothetical protein KR054_009014 [Drosophila jambulina]|nr:hypothetical protein KR054_009014 [Drosophila jambulina]
MKFSGVPLALALLSLGCLSLASEAAAAAAAPSAAAPASSSSSSSASSSGKPKRDAGLSFSSYHGPSHKYLPPAYEGHQLSYHGGAGGGGYHGSNSLSSYSTDYGHLESESGNGGHHYHHGYAYGSGSPVTPAGHGRPPHHHHYVPSPKIETYIVQTTSSGSHSGHGYHGHSAGHSGSHVLSHGPSHSFSHGSSHGLGYKYPAPGGAGSSAYLNLLGGGHKTSTYLLASPDYSGSSLHRPSTGYSSSSHGYSHGFGNGYNHHQIGSSHVEHSLEHALEHGLSHALGLGLGHASGGAVNHGSPAEEHSGYTYDAPVTPFGKGAPPSSYGVPLIPGYGHHQQESLQEQVLEQEHKLERERDQERERETPVYALGHKGLGHFSYTASKPQALHTDVLGVTHTPSDLELSKAPFKPSAFLGAKHETSSNSISGYDYATPTSPFLQAPSSSSPSGYDYQAPAQLYGPPGHSGDSATPIFEPEATYLPPPAASSHGYH